MIEATSAKKRETQPAIRLQKVPLASRAPTGEAMILSFILTR